MAGSLFCRTEYSILSLVNGERIEWAEAAFKHGINKRRIRHVIEHCGLVFEQPAPPTAPAGFDDPRLMHLGDDEEGVALEVIAVELEPEGLLVIHAMKLRKKYRKQYREAKQWRI